MKRRLLLGKGSGTVSFITCFASGQNCDKPAWGNTPMLSLCNVKSLLCKKACVGRNTFCSFFLFFPEEFAFRGGTRVQSFHPLHVGARRVCHGFKISLGSFACLSLFVFFFLFPKKLFCVFVQLQLIPGTSACLSGTNHTERI